MNAMTARARLLARIERQAALAARQRAVAVARARAEHCAAESRRARLAQLIGESALGPADAPPTVSGLGAAAGLRALLGPALVAADARLEAARAELDEALAAHGAAEARRTACERAAVAAFRLAAQERDARALHDLPGRAGAPA